MVKIFEKEATVYMVAQHKLDAKDYENLTPVLTNHLKVYQEVSWYIEMQNFEGWTASVHWKGIELDLPNEKHLKRVALVGNVKWQELFTEVLLPFSRAHIKFFKPEDKDCAKEWIEKLDKD
ncbi:SpoIIAA family protein [Arenibacter algicola]|uniref:SpoIIAA-like protein n=1 Tax=Arenibacter algicola TaxID=616991 RepID=A0A221UXA9_9FLAO|nr:STAS/SEC14 domain-containing protein [Arenibacter algicola]ASO06019.1 SpoIIAA-like protein [Arenibacter algicola]|tara:strand:- start:1074 stop:1436 length:363 start_codon:yes stop_codon:yes gene_type:complete